MRSYDFNEKLDWKSFQVLAVEIVQYRENIQFQTFRDGRDKGADGLWFDDKKKIILQAKRYKNFSDLYRQLKIAELEKVRRLNPDRYILVVSLKLSKHETEKIYDLFSQYMSGSDDLIDGNGLNSILAKTEYRWIERNFTSLWIPDGQILEDFIGKIINKGSRARSFREQKKAIEACKTFVQTGIYDEARQILENNHTVVISGQPGMGKSTIARVLAMDFLSVEYYEGLYWVNSFDEIEDQWEDSCDKQVFIMDDYWGAVFHRERGRRENSHLEDLICQIKTEDSKRLIITSREYIVQQEFFLNPELEDIIKDLKMECILREYTDAEKAKILFSHLQASDLDIEYIREIYRRCNQLVKNRSYSPRVIDRFLKESDPRIYSASQYAEELLGWMKYPEKFWEGIFREFSEEAKIIASIVVISYTLVSIADIRATYSSYIRHYGGICEPKTFENCISELEETVLITYFEEESDKIMVEFENPSIVDFLSEYVFKNQEFYIPRLIRSSIFYDQLLMILEHFSCHDEKINDMVRKRCVREFYKMPMRLEEYGDPQMGEVINPFESDWSGRAFHLMRVSDDGPGGIIWEFIRSFADDFFCNIEENKNFDGTAEMMNFVGLIKVCLKSGMYFDGKTLMDQYWAHCATYKDYEGFGQFEEVFPDVYSERKYEYYSFMKANVKDIILQTLNYYEENELFEEEDLLVDDIPFILKDWGLYYTKRFKSSVKEIAGRYSERPEYNKHSFTHLEGKNIYRETDYDQAKKEGYEILFGKYSECSSEQVEEIIKQKKFSKEREAYLIEAVQSEAPWYLYEFMTDESSIDILRILEEKSLFEFAVSDIRLFVFSVCYIMSNESKPLIRNFVDFCIDYTRGLLYKEVPMVSETQFRKSEPYKTYVANDPDLENLLFTYMLGRSGKWIFIKQDFIALFWLCQALICDSELDWDTVFETDWNPFFVKSRDGEKAVYFPDFINPSNSEWIRKIQIIMNEIDANGFRDCYVIPKLKGFLEKYSSDVSGTVNFLNDIRWSLDIDSDGELQGGSAIMTDTMVLADNLGIADIMEAADVFSEDSLKLLFKRKDICIDYGGYRTIELYKERDKDYLERSGIFNALRYYLNKVEDFVKANSQ